jgi:hypothetical protein
MVISPLVALVVYLRLVVLVGSTAPALFSFMLIGNVYNLAVTAFFVVSTTLLWNTRGR